MKKILNNSAIAIIILLTISVLAVMFWANDESEDYYLNIGYEKEKSIDGIKNVSVEFVDSKIYLKVELERPNSCSNVMSLLGIETLYIKNKSYIPVCSIVDDKLIKITYSERMQA